MKPAELLTESARWHLHSLLLSCPTEARKREAGALLKELKDVTAYPAGATEGIYHAIFGPGGRISPREVSHAGFEDPGRLLADLSAFYRAFAFSPALDEPADHVAVEAAFVAYLFLKEAYAGTKGDADAEEITRKARERFISEHLARLAYGIGKTPTGTYLDPIVTAVKRCVPEPAQAGFSALPSFDPLEAGCGLSTTEEEI
jgi:nitrate reductase assembly molybdenum cofactor insertion protein NarJ